MKALMPMMERGSVIVLLLITLSAGCAADATPQRKRPPASQPAVAPITNTDACATRLHDLCGPLLLYYATHGQLPARAEELFEVPGFSLAKELTCPVSRKPYTYNRIGLPTPGSGGRVILYDATPTHQGHRWAIAIKESGGNEPLVAKVIALPETFFSR